MALLQSVEALRTRLALSDADDINSALEGALEMATVSIQASVRTDLSRATVVDTYFVKNSREFPPTGTVRRNNTDDGRLIRSYGANSMSFKLSRGFVDSGQTITAYAAPEEEMLAEEANRQDLKVVGTRDRLTIDFDKGVAWVQDYSFQNQYVEISYTAGLTTDGGTPEIYESAPGWLTEATMIKAQILINSNPVYAIQRGERDGLTRTEIQTLQQTIAEVILSKSRYSPMAKKPRYSVETAL